MMTGSDVVGALGRAIAAGLTPRTPTRRRVAWSLSVGGPVAVTLVLLPFRPSIGLAGSLFCTLLVVAAAGVLGGVGPAVLGVVVGYLAGALLFSPPYLSWRIDKRGDLVALLAFLVVGASIGLVVDELARLAEEQAALRRVTALVAQAAQTDSLFAALTEEVGRLLGVDVVHLNRYTPDGQTTVLAGWSRSGDPIPIGVTYHLGGENLSTRVFETGRPANVASYDEASGEAAALARRAGGHAGAATPIVVEGRLWGAMVAITTGHRSPARHAEARLVGFTELIASAIANTESRDELAASRARVVAAADEARRRIERDLHDGTQQRLVSLSLDLRAAEANVPPEMGLLREQLSRAAKGLSDVVEDLQEISRGIHPAILTKGGLEPALKALARRSALPVELDLRTPGRLPDPVEVAVYYVTSEALTNSAKHGRASVVHVDLHATDGSVQLSIDDDGVGGADPTRGSGLVGLRDRVETLGGTIEIVSPEGSGTSVRVRIPV